VVNKSLNLMADVNKPSQKYSNSSLRYSEKVEEDSSKSGDPK